MTEICSKVNDEQNCPLAPYYEPLPKVFLDFLEVPEGAELRFPIECEKASEFMCPYVKQYYYSSEFDSVSGIQTVGSDGEVFWIPKLKIPYRGRYQTPYAKDAIYLVEPHAKRIWLAHKSMIVKKDRLPRDIEINPVFYVGEYVYGILDLGDPLEENGEKVRKEYRDSHTISDVEWHKWWGDPEKVWTYRFHIGRNFRYAFEYYAPKGVQTIIRDLKLADPTKIEHPTAKYVPERAGEIERAVPEIPLDEIVERPMSYGTLQRHKIGERVHADLRLRWYDKAFRKLTNFARGFTLTKVPEDLPDVSYGEKILAIPKACPRVFWWEKVGRFPTLFIWESKGSPKIPVRRSLSDRLGLDIIGLIQISGEIQPLDWFSVEGEIPIGEPGSGAHLPGHFEFIEKKFKYILGCFEPNFVEIFCFGDKLSGRYVFRKVEVAQARWREPGKIEKLPGKVHRWVFWRTKDQGRFNKLKELLRGKGGEVKYGSLAYREEVQDGSAKGVFVEGEATHVGMLESTYRGKRKVFTTLELFQAARSLRHKPILYREHFVGREVGEVFWSSFKEGGIPFNGVIWDSFLSDRLRKGEAFRCSVGYDFRGSKPVDGIEIQDIDFTELVILESDQFPGDPKAFLRGLT